MKKLFRIPLLFIILSIFCVDCNTEKKNIAENEVKKETTEKKESKSDSNLLSPDVRIAFRESAVKSCACMEKHGDYLKKSIAEIQTLLSESEKNKTLLDTVKRYKEITSGFSDFETCMKATHPSKKNPELEKKILADIRKIAGNDALPKDENRLRKSIILKFMQKNCSEEAKTLQAFRNLGDAVKKYKSNSKNQHGGFVE